MVDYFDEYDDENNESMFSRPKLFYKTINGEMEEITTAPGYDIVENISKLK